LELFTRSPSGIRNTALFFGVTFTVYTEGRKSTTISDVLAGDFASDGPDIKFWGILFSRHLPKLSCHFKAIGGKDVVVGMANHVNATNIPNVILCLDADHDHRRNRILKMSNVLYTRGYSWENDALSIETITHLHDGLCLSGLDRSNHLAVLKSGEAEFVRKMRTAVLLDILYRVNYGAIPLAAVWKSVLGQVSGQGCNLSCTAMIAHLKTLNRTRQKLPKARKVIRPDVLRECHGHLRHDYCYERFRQVAHQLCGQKEISKLMFSTLVINSFGATLVKRPVLVNYYRRQFKKLELNLARFGRLANT
jgi:hypothetical protein